MKNFVLTGPEAYELAQATDKPAACGKIMSKRIEDKCLALWNRMKEYCYLCTCPMHSNHDGITPTLCTCDYAKCPLANGREHEESK